MTINSLAAAEQEQAHFYLRLREGFELASARTGEIVRDFRLAGTSVRLRFAGEGLIPTMVPGLAFPVDSLSPGPRCEICLWDSETTGVALAPPPRPWNHFTERGNIWGFDSSRYRSAYQWGEGSVNVMDRETREAVFWVPSHKYLPAWVLASPLRSILHWWMELNGRQLVHAAAVGYGDRGVLIPGRGGSGKSSTSVACLLAGLDFISDDYLAVSLDPEPRLHRLYATAKLDPRSLDRYPDLAGSCRTVHQPGFDKVVLFLEDRFHDQLRESLPLNLVLRPRISGLAESTLGPVEPCEIERALASETLVHLPHVGAQTVEFLDRIAHQVPRATMHLGTDPARIAMAIRAALKAQTTSPVPQRYAGKSPPFVSLIVYLREEDRQELKTLASNIEDQGYAKTELIVMAGPAAGGMADEFANLPGSVRFFPLQDPVLNAAAWNRGIRESFSELIVLLSPGDRFPPGALEMLVTASELESEAAWVRGKVLSSVPEEQSLSPQRGALIRKSAFRNIGLFDPEPIRQKRAPRDWFNRAQQNGLIGRQIEAVTLHAGATATPPQAVPLNLDWGFVRTQLRQLRQKTSE